MSQCMYFFMYSTFPFAKLTSSGYLCSVTNQQMDINKIYVCILSHITIHQRVSVASATNIREWHKNTNNKQIICFKWSQLGTHYFLVYLFQLLYTFRATMCPSSVGLTVSMRHWCFSLCMGGSMVGCQPTILPPIQSEKHQCRIDTVSPTDDGHIVARNV